MTALFIKAFNVSALETPYYYLSLLLAGELSAISNWLDGRSGNGTIVDAFLRPPTISFNYGTLYRVL
jgi:hypothetical protein